MNGLYQLIYPLEWVTAWVMVRIHEVLTALGMPAASGWTWALSITGLVIVVRIVLIPLFVKQIKASRGMALLQPEMRKITQKYKGKTDAVSRQAQSRETMELYKHHKTNPFSSCLPILLQLPVFLALFHLINDGIRNATAIGPLTRQLAIQARDSSVFGVQLTQTFTGSEGWGPKLLIGTMIIIMSITTFTTQRQLMMKNMPASALDNPFAQQQKLIMYIYPVIFAVTGVNFPVGVLIYWLATNLWTGGQQAYVIRRMPAPGSPAEKAMEERRALRAARRGRVLPGGPGSSVGSTATVAGEVVAQDGPRSGQRQQPKRKGRGGKPAKSSTSPAGSSTSSDAL